MLVFTKEEMRTALASACMESRLMFDELLSAFTFLSSGGRVKNIIEVHRTFSSTSVSCVNFNSAARMVEHNGAAAATAT